MGKFEYAEKLTDMVLKQNKAMRVSVQIPHDEVDRLIVTELIKIRNCDVNLNSDMSHFDKVIKHWLDDSEFEKYVTQQQPMR